MKEGLNTASIGRGCAWRSFSRILCDTIFRKSREDGAGVCTDGAPLLAHFERKQHISQPYLSRNEDECKATLSENKREIILTGVIEALTFVRRLGERICIRAFVEAIVTLLSLLCLVCCLPNLAPDADRRSTMPSGLWQRNQTPLLPTVPSGGGAPFGRRRRSAKAFK